MKARIYKDEKYKHGWIWEVRGNGWEVSDYTFTKWGAKKVLKRLARQGQRVTPRFEVTIEEEKE